MALMTPTAQRWLSIATFTVGLVSTAQAELLVGQTAGITGPLPTASKR